MSTTRIELHRGDVVLIAFPFIVEGQVARKRRPAVVVQADRYNRRREAIVIAAFAVVRWYDRLGNVVVSHEIEALERALCASEPPREGGT